MAMTPEQRDNVPEHPWDRPKPWTIGQRLSDAMSKQLPIGSGDCWCGEIYHHDWPGKNNGAPHPREQRCT